MAFNLILIIAGNAQAFTFSLLSAQVLHGQFGHYWMLREGTIVLALLLNVLETSWQKAPFWLASLRTLRWEPLLGVAVLLCTGLLTVFSGTLHPAVASQNDILAAQGQNTVTTSLETNIQTTYGQFGLTLNVSPNHQGLNAFTLHILKQPGTTQNVSSVVLYITIPGMDMHTDTVQLQPDAQGNFSGGGIFSMPGRWQIRIELYTTDKQVHRVQLRLLAP